MNKKAFSIDNLLPSLVLKLFNIMEISVSESMNSHIELKHCFQLSLFSCPKLNLNNHLSLQWFAINYKTKLSSDIFYSQMICFFYLFALLSLLSWKFSTSYFSHNIFATSSFAFCRWSILKFHFYHNSWRNNLQTLRKSLLLPVNLKAFSS